jgi:D-alanyl-lipoteichoic acid acyltransferase DltB (MBOAT superfamily)
MLFNSTTYGVFLFAAYLGFWLLRTHRLGRTLFLVLASYVFYFYGTYDSAIEQGLKGDPVPVGPIFWSFLCLAIIFVGSTLDFGIGRLLGKTETPWKRKALLLASIGYYLGVLAIFKYYDFALDSFAQVARLFGAHVTPRQLHLVLPFGISFFTFETMSYTIDVYRREFEPAKKYTEYLLFVCFFPHLVAGPIVRPQQMLPQFEHTPVLTDEKRAEAFFLIAKGLMKKVVIGDTLSINMVGRVFDNPERFSALEVLIGVYCYAIKIYADFSGYTDVAIGSARLFGYELPENFNAPYTAKNLQDFWHRWHISLSTWLRDYLYIPLGGSRATQPAIYRNLMITMLLGGLWHGASWNFVIWGFLHGLALALTRAYQRSRKPAGEAPLWKRALMVVLTFHYVCFAWIFFKASTFAGAVEVLKGLGHFSFGILNLPLKVALLLAVGAATHFVPKSWEDAVRGVFVRSPAIVQAIVLAIAAYTIHFASGSKAEPFIYGQF